VCVQERREKMANLMSVCVQSLVLYVEFGQPNLPNVPVRIITVSLPFLYYPISPSPSPHPEIKLDRLSL